MGMYYVIAHCYVYIGVRMSILKAVLATGLLTFSCKEDWTLIGSLI